MTILSVKKILRFIFIFIIAITLFFSGLFPWFYKQLEHQPQDVVYSPNKRFTLEFHPIPFLPFKPLNYNGMGCSDCPGYVRLIDNRHEKILEEKYFFISHIVSNGIFWEKNEVNIKLFVTWDLPE